MKDTGTVKRERARGLRSDSVHCLVGYSLLATTTGYCHGGHYNHQAHGGMLHRPPSRFGDFNTPDFVREYILRRAIAVASSKRRREAKASVRPPPGRSGPRSATAPHIEWRHCVSWRLKAVLYGHLDIASLYPPPATPVHSKTSCR
jgi:hypothetical protein